MFARMKSLTEIGQAPRELPPQERLKIARWLLEDLHESDVVHADGSGSGEEGKAASAMPDYAGRRRRIFGGIVLPNMVLAARG
jgi:hypothetical protein